MSQPNDFPHRLFLAAACIAIVCTVTCVTISVLWINSERRLATLSTAQNSSSLPDKNVGSAQEQMDLLEKQSAELIRLRNDIRALQHDFNAMKQKAIKAASRPWGPEQATGEPDVFEAGDNGAAWASATQDDQSEWLLLEYEEPFKIAAVKVYETFNPGALTKVSVFDENGTEIVAWSGVDPTSPHSEKGISLILLDSHYTSSKIKLYLDSPKVPGWNEIDAVGLVDSNGKTHWAISAEASSTYATRTGGFGVWGGVDLEQRVPRQPRPQEVVPEF